MRAPLNRALQLMWHSAVQSILVAFRHQPLGASVTVVGPCHAVERRIRWAATRAGSGRCTVTLGELGSLGEFLAALATLATLIYLAIQIRQNTRATRAASHHAITDAMNSVNHLVCGDAEVARIWVTGRADRSVLNDEERERFDLLMLSYFHVFDTLYYQARVGAGDQELLLAEEKGFVHLLAEPGISEWWTENPYAFSPAFRSYMEGFRSVPPASES